LSIWKRFKDWIYRREDSYPAQFGDIASTASEVNFDYSPYLIRNRIYEPTKSGMKQWVKYSPVAYYLVKTLVIRAIGEGVLVDDEEFDVSEFLEVVIDSRTFGVSILNGKQHISGEYVMEIEKDDFGNILEFKLTNLKRIDPEKVFYIVEDEPYLLPIWDNLVYIYWIQFSMCEAASREGAKFVVVETEGLDVNNMNVVRSRFGGLSNRKMAVYDNSSIKKIDVLDTNLNATFTDYISMNLKMISLYTGVPEAVLTGVNAGAVTGSEVNVGSLYEVYRSIQKHYEKWFKKYLKYKGINFSKIKWKKRYRMSEKEEEELKLLRAQRLALELGSYKTEEEVRKELEEMGQI